MKKINRRQFIFTGSVGASVMASGFFAGCASAAKPEQTVSGAKKFKMKFAPRGLFSASVGKDPFKRLKWLSENGFWAVEGVVFCKAMGVYSQKEMDLQTAIGKFTREVGLDMGCISSMNEKDFPTMTANQVPTKDRVIRDKAAVRAVLTQQLDTTLGVLQRIGSTRFIVGPGAVDKELTPEKQYENVVDNMIFCADYCKRNGVVMEIEALNTTSHPGVYCNNNTLAAKIARDVNSPACRILYDIFHEQMQTGNLDSLDDPNVWNMIESFHIADAPQRMEPGTGTIPYKKVLGKIWDKGYRGFIGLEHGQSDKSIEGDKKLLQIYRDLDSAAS